MRTENISLECLPAADFSALKITVIYEDFISGLRAKNFSERVAEQLGCQCHLSESMWRSELLECPPIAAAAAGAARDSDYVIVSLRGDRVLPFAARKWIESQLEGAAERGAGLIVLWDSRLGKWRVLEATRNYLRAVCAAQGVNFFSHTVNPSDGNGTPSAHPGQDSGQLALSMPGWINAPRQNLNQQRFVS